MSTYEDDDIVDATGTNAPLDDLGGAHKNDDGKARLDLLPVPFLHPQMTSPDAVALIGPELARRMAEIEAEGEATICA